ncbi:11S globulin seed storage protein 2 [Bienertia sinuspersici]
MENMSLLALEVPQKLTEGDGGSYYSWNSTVFPYLGHANVSGGHLIMKPRGFAFPHYADCNKIGYVIEGTNGVVGVIYPGCTEEKVVKLEKGDAIFLESGTISWWFNAGTNDLELIFLGETRNATKPGEISYSVIAGAVGVLKGFSPKVVGKVYDLSEEQVNELINSQKQPLITSITEEISMPKPSKNNEHITFKFEHVTPDISIDNGGSLNTLTSEKYSPLEGIQLSGKLLKLEPNAMFGPCYYARDSGIELIYVTKGSGWVQIVGMFGQMVLDTKLEAGQLFAVPKFYVVVIGAGQEGIECFSIITTSRPTLGEIAGKNSLWKALSPEVLQVSLNVNPDLEKFFLNHINKSSIIMPPS